MTLLDVAKYRWEFMRRNKEYRADYRRYTDAIGDDDRNNIQKEMAQKWVLLFGEVHDPKMPFDEIHIAEPKTAKQRRIAEKHKQWLEAGYRAVQECFVRKTQNGVLIDIEDPINDEITSDDLLILIKPSRINSVSRVKRVVCELIDAHCAGDLAPVSSVELPPQASDEEHKRLIDDWFSDCSREEGQIYKTDFDAILRIGDWIELDKIDFRKVAEKVYPEKCRDKEDDVGDPESAIRAVRKVHDRYRYLIEKGFLKITVT